ncbi:MAG: hypothetical protein B0A82_05310 [Alkalinema sp. CACIAM 70d]|nr:MAG: hypothetical protein B0A82_05310 [Alkalinema sp. CACIAM 70d]
MVNLVSMKHRNFRGQSWNFWLAGWTIGACLLGLVTGAQAATYTLYDGAKNTAPSLQGWITVLNGATQTVGGGATVLDTTVGGDVIQAGYSRLSQPFSLDPKVGYTLGIDVQLLKEAHASKDRAGLSVTLLGVDRWGVELAFWASDPTITDRLWVQNDGRVSGKPLFTHGEGTSFNPTTKVVHYDLAIRGSTYRLFANRNYSAPILTGALKNYSVFGPPYDRSNFLFVGDNTKSARGAFKLVKVELTNQAIGF